MTTEKLPIVYSKDYNISFFGIEHLHPFDTQKYKKIAKHLQKTLGISTQQMHEPPEITDSALQMIHTETYVQSLNDSKNIAQVAEMPILGSLPLSMLKKNFLLPIRKATAGSIIAGRLAMEHGWAVNLSGGYHHAKAGNGEGFCFFADINMIIEQLRQEQLIGSALIVDLDAHQGNGHESVHGKDSLVYIMDMYNQFIYPGETHLKPYINYDIPLNHKTEDAAYLNLLKENLPKALEETKPDILIYAAGTDIYELDPLGNLSVSKAGIMERDSLVFQYAEQYNVPIVMLLSGGYHKDSGPIIGESLEAILRTKGDWSKNSNQSLKPIFKK